MLKYRTIVADPPWRYDDGFVSYPGQAHSGRQKRTDKPLPYEALSVEEIVALPIDEMAAEDSALFLWTTNRYLPDSFSVFTAWGFQYAQLLVWHKTGNPTPFGGTVAPNHAEFLLVGVCGKPTFGRLPSSVIAVPKPYRHSAKPDVFLDLVETISPGPYLELFARRARFGWDYWGDESLGTAELVTTT